MMRRTHLAFLLAPLVLVGCKTQKDIDEAVAAANAAQKAAFDAEMQKAQEAHKKELDAREARIGGLESEVTALGGDLSKVKTELGSKDTQLASTKTELEATAKERDQLRKLREQAEKEAAQYREVSNKLKAMVDAGTLEVINRKGRLTLKLPDNILFPSGSQKLKKEGTEALQKVADVLKGVEGRDFLIAGHTDNVPVKKGGAFRDNWSLSTARAVEVVNLMVAQGVPAMALGAAGFGEFDPIGDNTTPEGREKNRRLEIILMPKIEEIPAVGAK
ncbi:OmpA family protein [Myxococcota bacterium]|nr:OmpA family protein [Myxococcota bacterium]